MTLEQCVEKFLRTVQENPGLPVYFWVDCEVVCGDEYGRWLGEIGDCRVADVAMYDGEWYEGQEELNPECAVYRLAAIENILGDTYDLDHLRELVEADKDGRCVVLPCKVGTPVYWVVDVGVFECYFNLAAVEEVGKTVFLTREAAEAALAKEAK